MTSVQITGHLGQVQCTKLDAVLLQYRLGYTDIFQKFLYFFSKIIKPISVKPGVNELLVNCKLHYYQVFHYLAGHL